MNKQILEHDLDKYHKLTQEQLDALQEEILNAPETQIFLIAADNNDIETLTYEKVMVATDAIPVDEKLKSVDITKRFGIYVTLENVLLESALIGVNVQLSEEGHQYELPIEKGKDFFLPLIDELMERKYKKNEEINHLFDVYIEARDKFYRAAKKEMIKLENRKDN